MAQIKVQRLGSIPVITARQNGEKTNMRGSKTQQGSSIEQAEPKERSCFLSRPVPSFSPFRALPILAAMAGSEEGSSIVNMEDVEDPKDCIHAARG